MHNIMLRNYCDVAGSGAALQETMIILVKNGPPHVYLQTSFNSCLFQKKLFHGSQCSLDLYVVSIDDAAPMPCCS
jgi:hypothetical protein